MNRTLAYMLSMLGAVVVMAVVRRQSAQRAQTKPERRPFWRKPFEH